jgi:nucleoside-diphosphate-sugar epimerase
MKTSKKLNKNEKRILITGSSGMLGKDLVKKIK